MDNSCPLPPGQWSTKSPWVVLTTTTISTAEIANTLTKGKQLLADLALQNGWADMYKIDKVQYYPLAQLYLLLYAVESWDITANAMNFMNQDHLISVLSAIEQLFYICTINKPC